MSGLQQNELTSFREFEHSGWQMVADQYERYFAGLTQQTIEPLLDAVITGASLRLLDVAAGPGHLSLAAAGRGAAVTGIDFSSVMVKRARDLYPNLEFVEGDAEALPFDGNSFDAVAMNFGLLHLDKPDRAVSEAWRVLAPRARFGFSVWAPPEESIGFQIVVSAIQQRGNPSVPLPEGPPFFKFSHASECTRILSDAGFAEPQVTKLALTWRLDSPADLFRAFYLGTPRTGGLLRAQQSADLAKIERAVVDAATAYATADGVHIPMAALVASGAKL